MGHPLRDYPGTVLVFGNPQAHALLAHPDAERAAAGERTYQEVETSHPSTLVLLPEGVGLVEALLTITSPQGVVAAHAAGGVDFVASSNEPLARLVAAAYSAEVVELSDELLEAHQSTGAGVPPQDEPQDQDAPQEAQDGPQEAPTDEQGDEQPTAAEQPPAPQVAAGVAPAVLS